MTRAETALGGGVGNLADVLACPLCHSDINQREALYVCTKCGQTYPQASAAYLQLMPPQIYDETEGAWRSRQAEMRTYYQEMISAPPKAAKAVLQDGAALAPLLAKFSGRVLDIGGGSGLMRLFTPNIASYFVVEPEVYWFSEQWRNMHIERQRRAAPVVMVQGVGERLPFKAKIFDGAVSLWSLNHARQPSNIIDEAGRVLRPGAPFTVLLEDMEPGTSDILNWAVYNACTWREAVHLWGRRFCKLFVQVGPWYVAPDHVRITEEDMAAWADGRFHLESRRWIDRYLALEFRRR